MSEYSFTTVDERIRKNTRALFEIATGTKVLNDDEERRVMQLIGADPAANVDLSARSKHSRASLLSVFMSLNEEAPLQAIRILIDGGAQTDLCDDSARTPLHHASYYERKQGMKYLIEAGADVDAMQKNGDTPVMSVVDMVKYLEDPEKLMSLIRILQAAGASLHGENAAGETAQTMDADYGFAIIQTCIDTGRQKLEQFREGNYTPATREDWNYLASAMPVEDPRHLPSVSSRLRMLQEMRPDIDANLGTVRQGAARIHARAEGI